MEFCLRPVGAIGTYARKALTYFLRRGTVEGSLKKKNIERPTSNVEWEK